jgi:hypothetical protein
MMGSTCVARNAGRYMAASETAMSRTAAMPYTAIYSPCYCCGAGGGGVGRFLARRKEISC